MDSPQMVLLNILLFPFKVGGCALSGIPLMLCGHFFLRLSNAPGYQDVILASSLKVGVVGGTLMAVPTLIMLWIIARLIDWAFPDVTRSIKEHKWTAGSQSSVIGSGGGGLCFSVSMFFLAILLAIASIVGTGAGVGYSGSAVLRATGHNDILDVFDATRAGTVGAVILAPGALVAVALLLCCCGVPTCLCCWLTHARKAKGTQLEKVPDTEAPDTAV